MLVCVYTCQNATLLEITCHGSIIRSPFQYDHLWQSYSIYRANRYISNSCPIFKKNVNKHVSPLTYVRIYCHNAKKFQLLLQEYISCTYSVD